MSRAFGSVRALRTAAELARTAPAGVTFAPGISKALGLSTAIAAAPVVAPVASPVPAICAHEDIELRCPFGCSGTVDADTLVCAGCQEMVAPVKVCVYCEEDVTAFWPYTKEYAAKHPAAFGGSHS